MHSSHYKLDESNVFRKMNVLVGFNVLTLCKQPEQHNLDGYYQIAGYREEDEKPKIRKCISISI